MKSKSNTEPWYRDGLRFECTQCGDCCSGDPGFVYVEPDEIDRMADAMDMDVEVFRDQFIRKVGARESLKEYPDGDCILLDPETRKCSAYDGRPIQCRTWPFWDSTLKSPKAWKETCEVCPGSGGGKLYGFDQIEVWRREKSV